MADRTRYNRFSEPTISKKDKYTFEDYVVDQTYTEQKPRDIFAQISNPPYVVNGLNVTQNASDPLKIDISAGTAFDKNFKEINGGSIVGYPMFDTTSGVINYLTIEFQNLTIPGSDRLTFKDDSISYKTRVIDYHKYQWKLSAPINPEQTGTITGPFNITKDLNDKILFSTDQSNPEYNITLTPNVASISGNDIGSGSVLLEDGINDNFIFTVDLFEYNLDLTNLATESLTLSGVAARINSRAFVENPLLTQDIAFVISGENRIRITSPRDATAVSSKKVEIGNGNSNVSLGFIENDISNEIVARTAQNIVDEINIFTIPEITASVLSNRVKLFAQEPDGFIEIQNVTHNAYATLGLNVIRIDGAVEIDFNNDVILAGVQNINNAVDIDTTLKPGTIQLFDNHVGWEHIVTLPVLSGEPSDVIIEVPNNDYYVVGKNELEVFVNQGRAYRTKGYDEIGVAGQKSTEIELYNVLSSDEILIRTPTANPAGQTELTVSKDDNIITIGTDTLNFGKEFSLKKFREGKAEINLNIISGDIIGSGVVLANHGKMHEYGGSMEIDVTNLNGLLLQPQKSFVYVRDNLLYAPTGFNFTGNRFNIFDSGSGYINIDIDEKVFVNDAGDSIVRLGFDGGTVLSNLTLQNNSDLYNITVNNEGQLLTELVGAGTPLNIVLESPSGNLYNLSVETVFGSGEIFTELTTSGTPFVFSLEAPNGKGWGVRVEDDGTLYTLDPENKFELQNSDGEEIFRVEENGAVFLHKYKHSAPSGSVHQLPSAEEISGGIALYEDVSGDLFPMFSDGYKYFRFNLTEFTP